MDYHCLIVFVRFFGFLKPWNGHVLFELTSLFGDRFNPELEGFKFACQLVDFIKLALFESNLLNEATNLSLANDPILPQLTSHVRYLRGKSRLPDSIVPLSLAQLLRHFLTFILQDLLLAAMLLSPLFLFPAVAISAAYHLFPALVKDARDLNHGGLARIVLTTRGKSCRRLVKSS